MSTKAKTPLSTNVCLAPGLRIKLYASTHSLLHPHAHSLLNPHAHSLLHPHAAASWCKGHPEVCPSPSCPEPLNPATNATFDLLSGLFLDLTGGARGSGLFFDNMMHLGGDEVCMRVCERVRGYLYI